MIRCKKCKSTFPKFIDTDTVIDYDNDKIIQKFECDCGHKVDVFFKLVGTADI